MKKLVIATFVFGFFFFANQKLSAQDDCCGFGSIFSSLVQSGIYGGYGLQQYDAKGLNLVIQESAGLSENFSDFETAWGWRLGANIIGFRQRDLLVTLKFYYQQVTEKQDADGTFQGEPANQELKLDVKNWNFGISLSYIINNHFDIRIFDLMLTFTNATFSSEITSTNAPPKQTWESPDTHTGFTANTGIVFYPLPPYISIEVIGGYSFFGVEKMEDTETSGSFGNTSDFIDAGGLFAMAVLTVGIPFN